MRISRQWSRSASAAARLSRAVAACALLAAVLAVPATAAAAPPAPPGDPSWSTPGTAASGAPPLPAVRAAAWVVADADTGAVLAAKDAHTPYPPASTLKVLTALALLPVVPPSRTVVPTPADVAVEGSKVGLLPGVTYTAEQLYTALFLVSGNDAANALATAAGGTQAAAELLNATARRLGADQTRAVNPHGLDAPGQVTTAYDLAVLGRAALGVPDIARWVSTQQATMPRAPGQPGYSIANHNRLLARYPGALGVKNGYTTAAQATYIGAAQRDGRRLVVTLMRATPSFWTDAEALLSWGFAAQAAGVRPVAALPAAAAVPPVPVQASAPARARPAPAGGSGPGGGSLAVPEAGGALLVAVTALAVRPRRRRR